MRAAAISPSQVAGLAWAGIGIVLVVSLALPGSSLPGNGWWLRRFHTPEVTNERTFGQTFVMRRDGLQAIEFHPAQIGSRISGDIRLALVDVTEGAEPRVVRTSTTPVTDLARKQSYRFEFQPITDSTNRTYRFEVSSSEMSSGLALRATKGDPYPNGTLTVNVTPRLADLLFQASAPTASMWQTLWTKRAEGGRPSGRLVLALLAANWIAIGFLFRIVLFLPAADV